MANLNIQRRINLRSPEKPLGATGKMKEKGSLERYISEVRSVWGDGRDPNLPFKVKELVKTLLASVDPKEPWIAQLIMEGRPSRELYRDREHGFIQLGEVHEKGYMSPPHDHGPCWVLYGVYHGAMEITAYQRTDDGRVAGQAKLEKKQVHRLTPGMVLPYLPGEIHSTSTVEHSIVLRFLSCDLNKVKRYRYDLAGQTMSPA